VVALASAATSRRLIPAVALIGLLMIAGLAGWRSPRPEGSAEGRLARRDAGRAQRRPAARRQHAAVRHLAVPARHRHRGLSVTPDDAVAVADSGGHIHGTIRVSTSPRPRPRDDRSPARHPST